LFADDSTAGSFKLTAFAFAFICPKLDWENPKKNNVVQIPSFICHLPVRTGGELGAGSEESQWTAD
jgi:hypothetical protein